MHSYLHKFHTLIGKLLQNTLKKAEQCAINDIDIIFRTFDFCMKILRLTFKLTRLCLLL